jgi:beta-glucanase (GH16 family)
MEGCAVASYQTLVNPANLTFDDEFNSFVSSPDGSVGWMTSYDYGGESARALPSNGEAQYFSDSSVGVNPFSIVNGVLDITATVAAPGSNPYGLPYNSGMITSFKSLSQIYGYFEIDAELPAGQGLWPAWYLLPTDVANQNSEIDVFEVLGNAPGTVYATVHWKVDGVAHSTTTIVNVANTANGFHTYGVDWEPTTTTIYMDGQVIASFATAPQMDQPMYMLAGLQVGSVGSWPGAPSSSAEFPATMQINYIRAYASANTIDVSGTQAIETAGITGKLQMAGVGWVGATVSLLNAAGTVIATTSTNASGTFSFANLAAGDYQLHYALPPGLAVQSGSPAAAGTGLTAALALTDGQTLSLPTEVLLAPQNPATIQSTVNLFGGAGDTTLVGGDSGVTVLLLDGSGNVIASTVSASNGTFSFGNLAASTYQLEYMPPNGQTIQPGGNANTTTGLTAKFTVAAGQTFTAPSGGMVPLASIDGTVVLNGVGESGVAVAVLNAAGSVVASATTGAGGTFAFTDLLAAGTYQLKYTAPSGQVLQTGGAANATTGITPTFALATSQVLTAATEQLLSNPGTISSAARNFGAPTDNSWGTGEGGVTVSLLNAAGTVIATTVTPSWGGFTFGGLAAGTYQLQYTPPAGQAILPGGLENTVTGLTAQFTVAAGQTATPSGGELVTLSSIGGTVLLGSADDANVTVALLNGTGGVVATTTTNSAGAFTFANLFAGNYQVEYTAPAGTMLEAGSEANAATGLTPVIALTYSETDTLPTEQLLVSPGTIQASVLEFGVPGGSVAGNADAGVTVSLLNAGTVVATAVSGSNGGVTFSNVTPGTYQLKYTPPWGQAIEPGAPENVSTYLTAAFTVAAGQTVTAPAGDLMSLNGGIVGAVTLAGADEAGVTVTLLNSAGTVLTSTTTDSTGAFDFTGLGAGNYEVKYTAPSGQVFQDGSEANDTTGITPVITLASNQAVTLPTEQLLSNPGSVTAATLHYGAPTDNSWGTGIGGVTVALLNAAGTVIATAVSNSSGRFTFGQLAPGTYQLQYTAPVGDGYRAGAPENPATGLTAQFTVVAGQTTTAPNANLVSNTVTGTVLQAGVGEAGVTVALLNSGGSIVATTTTGSTGAYTFTGMTPGSYEVEYTPPSGQVFALGSAANAVSGLTPAFAVTAGATVTLPSEMLLSNPATIDPTVLHFGAPTDPVGGSPEAGVTVELLNAGTVIATTTSDSTGSFGFGQLAPGTYQLDYIAPSGQAIDPAGPENTATGLTAPFTVAAGQTASPPAGWLISNTVVGTVQLDGVNEAGVTVSLFTATGTLVATTTSDSNGAYSFTGMVPGSYQVGYTPPSGQAIDPAGPESTVTGLTAPFTVAAGQTVTAPSGALIPNTVTGAVLLGGVGESGVTVSLFTATGTLVATTTSGSGGAYSFTGMAPGSYQVGYSAPSGQAIDPAGPENTVTGLTAPFTVAAGQTVTAPSGALIPNTVEGTVQLAGVGEAGVTVSLFTATGTLVATTTSGAGGAYSFTGMAPGSYQVAYSPPSGQAIDPAGPENTATGLTAPFTVGAGQTVTAPSGALIPNSVTGTVLLAGVGESGVTVSLFTATGTLVATTTSGSNGAYSFTGMAAGSYQVAYSPPSGQTIDPAGPENAATGLTAPFAVTGGPTTAPTGALVANSVVGDVLLAGVGEAGVTVSLFTAAGALVATTTSDNNGAYQFTGLAAGSYQVDYTPPSGQAIAPAGPESTATGLTAPFAVTGGQTTAPAGALVSNTVVGTVLLNGVGTAGVTVSLFTAAGALVATTTSGTGGAYSFTGMAAGSYQVGYTPPSGEAIDPTGPENTVTGLTAPFTVAAGQTVTAPSGALITDSISGAVALAGAAEAGVTVSLLSTAGKVLATTTTNGAGAFTFDGLAAGSYEVKYTALSGQVYQTGSEASAATGITPVIALANNQALTLATEQLLSSPGSITAATLHYGAPTDNSWGTGIGGVTVSLLNAAGTVIATAVSNSSGKFTFGQIGPGTYQLQYTAPTGDGFLPTGPDAAVTGLTAQFTVAAGQAVTGPNGDLISTIAMNGTGLTEVAPAGAYLVSGNAGNSTLTLGNGNQFVMLTGGGDTVTTGTGSQTISLAGNNNTVTIGTGNNTVTLTGTGNTVTDTGSSGTSTFNAGSGNDTVHVTGGTDNITINATGSGNLFDAGPGLNFLNADGSAGNTFMLNPGSNPSTSLTTITGFNPSGDILDLKRTLAGTDILPNMSNVGTLVTAAVTGANTTLYVNPTGHGTPTAFAVLDGVHVTVAQLQAAQELSLT